jgi:hypothetical protein
MMIWRFLKDGVNTLVLLASTFFRKRVLAPATEKSDGETGVLLAAGDGKRKVFFTRNVRVTDMLAECAGKKACHQNVMASGAFSTSPAPGKLW